MVVMLGNIGEDGCGDCSCSGNRGRGKKCSGDGDAQDPQWDRDCRSIQILHNIRPFFRAISAEQESTISPTSQHGALIRELPFSASNREDCQPSRDGAEKNGGARGQERAHRSHEIDLTKMVRWSEIPEKKIKHLEKFAAATPNPECQCHCRDEKRTDHPGNETKLFPRNQQTNSGAASGQNRDDNAGQPAGWLLPSQ